MEYAENRNTDYPMNETKNAAEVPAQSKFDLWEKKLLDLSRRNQLIDFKRKGKGLQVLYYDMQSLFDAFESRRKSYALCEAELHLTEQDSLELPCPEDIDNTEARLSLEREKLLLIRRCSDIPVSLKYFFRERKKAFEETGSNVFYLALGFVAWHDAERENAECFSPLILVPVDLKRSSKDSYSLTGRDETPFLNISAFQFFRQEYKVDFDDLLSAPLFDGDTADVEKIFGLVEQKLHTVPGMRVVRAAALNILRR